jgi:hypothetical protein
MRQAESAAGQVFDLMTNAKTSALETYRAHPLLDPKLPSRQPDIARYWLATRRQLLHESPLHLERLASAFAGPLMGEQLVFQPLERYFSDTDVYLEGLLSQLSRHDEQRLRTSRGVSESSDLRELIELTLEGPSMRSRYEARRKLYLAKLLFDIDHCRSVRDGPRHRALFEERLQGGLWSEIHDGHEEEVCCRLVPGLSSRHELEVGVPPSQEARCWTFKVRRLVSAAGSQDVEVYHYHSRFKRDVEHELEPLVAAVGSAARAARTEPGLGRRSGSILSKMIRRGIGDASRVQDLLGARFIVRDVRQALSLERRLLELFGGPARWRDRVDTLRGKHERDRLNRNSSDGFQVLKGIMDILLEDRAGPSPYLFSVEIQILPLEPYLRTVHEAHFASHDAYKRRQLVEELVPVLFPAEVYDEPRKKEV